MVWTKFSRECQMFLLYYLLKKYLQSWSSGGRMSRVHKAILLPLLTSVVSPHPPASPECPHSVFRAASRKRKPCCTQQLSLSVPSELGTRRQDDYDMKPCLRIESKRNIQNTELGILQCLSCHFYFYLPGIEATVGFPQYPSV